MKYRTGLLTFSMVLCAALTASAQLGLGGSLKSSTGVTSSAGRGSRSVGLNSGTDFGANLGQTMNGHTINGNLNSASQVTTSAEGKSKKSASSQVQSTTQAGVTSQVQSTTQAGAASGMQTASGRNDNQKDRGHASKTSVDVNSDSRANASLGRGSADVNGSAGSSARVDHQGRGSMNLGSMTNVQSNASAKADASFKGGKRK
jgi:hypothetical protein